MFYVKSNKRITLIALMYLSIFFLSKNTITLYGSMVITLVLVPFFLIYHTNNKVSLQNPNFIDLVPIVFLFIWIYGVILGFINGNAVNHIFANFIGLFFYVLYFLLVITRIKEELILKILLYLGMIVMIQNIIVAIMFFGFGIDVYYGGPSPIFEILFGYYLGGASTGQIRIMSPSQLIVFVVFALSLAFLMDQKLKKTSSLFIKKYTFVLLFLSGYVVLFMPASKGYVLAGVAILLFFLYVNILAKKINISRIFYSMAISIIAILIFTISGYETIIFAIFAEDDLGNVTRYDQLAYLLDDITFLGNGLGAVVPGSERDVDRPYGFELTYINLIHKFGVMSLFIFLTYIYTFYKIIKLYQTSSQGKIYASASIGLMAFVFPSIGNPILLSPQSVLMHVSVLYFLRNSRSYV